MVLLLIVSSWILISTVVGGLCLAAQSGDRQARYRRQSQPGWDLPESAVVACWSAEDAGKSVELGRSVARTAA